jgi:hypothetical protein
MADPDAGQAVEAEKPYTFGDDLAVDNFVIRTNQDRLRIAEPGDGIGDLPDMRGVALTQMTLAASNRRVGCRRVREAAAGRCGQSLPPPALRPSAAKRYAFSRFLVLISVLNRLAKAAGDWALFFRSFVMG